MIRSIANFTKVEKAFSTLEYYEKRPIQRGISILNFVIYEQFYTGDFNFYPEWRRDFKGYYCSCSTADFNVILKELNLTP